MFCSCSFDCSLGLWELDREKKRCCKKGLGIGVNKMPVSWSYQAAQQGRGLLKSLSSSITAAAVLGGCSPRWLLQSQASNMKDKCPKTKGKKRLVIGTFVALPSFVVITAGSLCLPHHLWHSEMLCAGCTALPLIQDTSRASGTPIKSNYLS